MKAMVMIPSPSHDDWTRFTPYKIYPIYEDGWIVNNIPYRIIKNPYRICLDIPQ